MDSDKVLSDIGYLEGCGIILSPEEKAALQTSLILEQTKNKFNRVCFWGKIQGVKRNYYIVVGIGGDQIHNRKYLSSQDCLEWGIMNHVTPDMLFKAQKVKGRFTGDPAFVYEQSESLYTQEASGEPDSSSKIEMKEEDRLAAVVKLVEKECSLVPRGALMKTPLDQVILNGSFEGLSEGHSHKLASYLHLREYTKIDTESSDPAFDFLETLEIDVPKGCWTLQAERGSGLVVLRSLSWIGFSAFHVPNTKKYGYLYFGTGEKNSDLPFML
ncbi:hypothetical protein LOD99_4320 [Oopsacas minuta]|uniref:Radial spoke head protein 9 homolog n=1 Tax=Oopsacas minuta TaxID=111878 RepID=A0AAV7JVU5_9METZ|nr:hypothetical protein LOD99_4320 [Oopsacas minuta]